MTRVRYFSGQRLTASDFETEQMYHIEKRRLQNRLLLGSGVVKGLNVSLGNDTAQRIEVSSGVAIDPIGNEIIVEEPVHAGPCPHLSGGCRVIIQYTETPESPAPAMDGNDTEFTRIREGFVVSIVADTGSEMPADAITLARLACRDGRWVVEPPSKAQFGPLAEK